MSQFGKVLRQLRTQRGISQSELGRLACIHPSGIVRYESGRRKPADPEIVQSLANSLHLTPGEEMQLFAASGWLPLGFVLAVSIDPTMAAVAAVAASSTISNSEKARFRAIVAQFADQYHAAAMRRIRPITPAYARAVQSGQS